MILSDGSIHEFATKEGLVFPFHLKSTHAASGMSYGLSPASYDVRIAQTVTLLPGEFKLASTIEHFKFPSHLSGQVADKSSWARRGLSLFNTFIDPGWHGYLTLELSNLSQDAIVIDEGTPIAQIIFNVLDQNSQYPYKGKYQDQPDMPVGPL